MKIKRQRAAENQLICAYGKARFQQKMRARSAWKDPKVPEPFPNWFARFQCGGETWEQMMTGYPCAAGLREVKQYAETLLRTRWMAIHQGRLAELEAIVKGADEVMLSELRRVYLQNVPPGKPDYRKNIGRLCSILTEATGLDEERLPVRDALWTRELLLGWVKMRQEHFRRGWTQRHAAPPDAWLQLREALKAGKLPGIDKDTVMECNTTIETYLRCAKAVFANQREYLVGLKLPDLREFLSFSVDLAAPQGHREIGENVLVALEADTGRLAREEPKVYAFYLLATWTGARPITIKSLPGDALRVLPGGSGEIVLPAAKGGRGVCVPVDAAAVDGLLAVRTAESLIGAGTKTEAALIHRAHNEWLTRHGVDGTLKTYQLRHRRLQQYREAGGLELAAAGGGHTTTAMVERRYTEGAKVIPLVNPFQKAG